MAKEKLGGSETSKLTPEQVRKMAGQESDLAFTNAQANDPKWTGKNAALAKAYNKNAKVAANTERINANLAEASSFDSEALNKDIEEANAAVAAAQGATKEAKDITDSVSQNQPGDNTSNKLIAPDGTVFQDPKAYAAYVGYLGDKQSAFDTQKRASQSAFDLMYAEFANYGLASLVEPLRGLVQNGISGDEFTLRLRETDAYKKRFAANAERLSKGLTALSEGEYLAKEDAYQNVMRNYGLPASYYAKDSLGTQAGFQKLLANDVSASELEERVIQAKDRVINSNPEVAQALKAYYPNIQDGDIVAYVLDPQNALKEIQRKISAAEIGGAALAQGLTAGVTRAEELAGLGINKQQAMQGYQDVAQMAPRGSQLADIYNQGPYNQQTAEAEVFGTAGAAQAAEKRKKLKALEEANFSGSSGVGALGRDRSNPYGITQSGYGQY
jgi:hypothetical protein